MFVRGFMLKSTIGLIDLIWQQLKINIRLKIVTRLHWFSHNTTLNAIHIWMKILLIYISCMKFVWAVLARYGVWYVFLLNASKPLNPQQSHEYTLGQNLQIRALTRTRRRRTAQLLVPNLFELVKRFETRQVGSIQKKWGKPLPLKRCLVLMHELISIIFT